MRIAICDDNQQAANYMEEYLSGLPLKDISFETLPFRFIIKPVTNDKLDKALRDALDNMRLMKRIFFFKVERATVQVPFDKIIYFESGGRKIKLVAADGSHEFYGKLSSSNFPANKNKPRVMLNPFAEMTLLNL